MKKMYYSKDMLPGVDYNYLEKEDIFCDQIVGLEYETWRILNDVVEEIKDLMIDSKMITVVEMLVTHLAGYLGFMASNALGVETATYIQNKINGIISREVKTSVELFGKYPIASELGGEAKRKENLGKLREVGPSSIVVQTMRLGNVIWDSVGELRYNYPTAKYERDSLVPVMPFILMLRQKCKKILKELNGNDEAAPLYHVNQTAVQIGWIIGYFSHLDSNNTEKRIEMILSYVLGSTKIFIEYGAKFLDVPMNEIRKMAREDMRSANQVINFRLN